jgi:hypothetical protein
MGGTLAGSGFMVSYSYFVKEILLDIALCVPTRREREGEI